MPPAEDPWPTMAPSALPFGPGWHLPRAMTEDDMARVVVLFTEAARRAVRIGFDAVELHMAHGYMLHGFFSPISNTRNDAWGGSLDGRMRFPLEVARAVRAVVPRGTPLGARLTGSDWTDGGLTVADAVALAKALKAAGLDYVDVSSGGVTTSATPPSTPGYNVPLAERCGATPASRRARRADRHARKQAEAIVAEGRADMVALAAPFSTIRIGHGTPRRRSVAKLPARRNTPRRPRAVARREHAH